MTITGDYLGGNIEVLRIEDTDVYLDNQLRDTQRDWFYWAFRVDGAQGQTLTFHFDKPRVGYWGAAVSADGKTWRWSDGADSDGTAFTYAFAGDETSLYFCHDMNYSYDRFLDFVRDCGLPMDVLTQSEKGRDVPLIQLGAQGPTLLLTSRHHCCESTGTYLLEGFLREFSQHPPMGFRVAAVPFMDLDGAIAGDQGKERAPHDHNRDYIEQPIYRSTAALMQLAKSRDVRWTLDLHAPWHRGHEHDYCYLLRNRLNDNPLREAFSRLLEEETKADPLAFPYCHDFVLKDFQPNWHSNDAYFAMQPGVEMALCIETTYAGNYYRKVSQQNLIELGVCAARALRRCIERA